MREYSDRIIFHDNVGYFFKLVKKITVHDGRGLILNLLDGS